MSFVGVLVAIAFALLLTFVVVDALNERVGNPSLAHRFGSPTIATDATFICPREGCETITPHTHSVGFAGLKD